MSSTSNRLDRRFAALKQQGRTGLVTFISAGDPDIATSQAILNGLPDAGADIIELGIPFSDPMADGPTIQRASNRALKAGITLKKVLAMATEFRKTDAETPLVLMGYYNSVLAFGEAAFADAAEAAGVDGLILVDLPPEEAADLQRVAKGRLHLIWLLAPTTPEARIQTIAKRAGGFLYYVSITGITGTASANSAAVAEKLAVIRRHTQVPIAVGFGIRTPEQAAAFAGTADAVVVGSAIVDTIAGQLDTNGNATATLVPETLESVRQLGRALEAPMNAQSA